MLIVGFLTMVPSAVAFHGGPFKASGTATGWVTPLVIGGDPVEQTYEATLWWSVFANQHYTLEVYDGQGNNLIWAEFLGEEHFGLATFDPTGCVETVDYVGNDKEPNSINPFSQTPMQIINQYKNQFLEFEISGWQQRNLCNQQVTMHYEGSFTRTNLETLTEENFSLVLDVWTVGNPV